MIRSFHVALLGLGPVALASACGDGDGTKTRLTRTNGGSGGTVMGESGAPTAGRRAMMSTGGSGGTTAMGEAGAAANASDAGDGGEAATTGGAGGSGNTEQAGSAGSSGDGGDGSGGAPEPTAGTGGTAGAGGSPAAGNGGTGGTGELGTPLTACAHPYGNYCQEYFGPSEYVDEFDFNCSNSEQNSVDACPEAFQGLCTVVQEMFTFKNYYYQLDAGELTDAAETCASDAGTWTTP